MAQMAQMANPLIESDDEYDRLRKIYDQNPEVKKSWPKHSSAIRPSPVSAGDVFRAAVKLERTSGRRDPSDAESHTRDIIRSRIDEPHVRVHIPIHHLHMQHDPSGEFGEPDSWSPHAAHDSRVVREKQYSKRRSPMPPIYATHNSRSARQQHKRGRRPTLYVANGNHRVAAAIRRGDTHIHAHVTETDWERFKSHADGWASDA